MPTGNTEHKIPARQKFSYFSDMTIFSERKGVGPLSFQKHTERPLVKSQTTDISKN